MQPARLAGRKEAEIVAKIAVADRGGGWINGVLLIALRAASALGREQWRGPGQQA